MAKSNILPIILIVIGGIMLIPILKSSGTDGNLITCDVIVGKGITTPTIESFNCISPRKCGLLDSITGKSIFGAEGYVRIVMDDGSSSKGKYDIGILQFSQTVNINTCSTSNTGKIYLYNQKNEILRTESFIV